MHKKNKGENREQWLEKCSDIHIDAVIYNNVCREIEQAQELKLSISVWKTGNDFKRKNVSLTP